MHNFREITKHMHLKTINSFVKILKIKIVIWQIVEKAISFRKMDKLYYELKHPNKHLKQMQKVL